MISIYLLLKDILHAHDVNELLDWLRKQPLLHHDSKLNFTMVHAGIYPEWDLKTAQESANELEVVLRSDDYLTFILNMYGNLPEKWDDKLKDWDRLRFICNSFTRMRYCEKDGTLNFKSHGAPGTHPENTLPWFNISCRKISKDRIVFGHWSTLGKISKQNVYALDTGCIWGGQLSALQLDNEKPEYISVDCPAEANPADFIK
jgi:bis(5'-nucleosyl)-tetraphosphatase (symmetrical)